jgi:GNAT superfamily N-acetyltransferase
MRLDYLADRPEFIMPVATWIYQEWREEFATVGLDAWLAEFRGTLMRDGMPTTFVATEGPGLLGTASLITSDLPERPELSPWLASVYVLPRYRRTGIATALIGRVLAQASWLGMEQVHLHTATKVDFYRRLGWVEREQLHVNGRTATVMSKNLGLARRTA